MRVKTKNKTECAASATTTAPAKMLTDHIHVCQFSKRSSICGS